MSPDDPRHGTVTGYKNQMCRCPDCCLAYSRYNKRRGHLAATGRPLRVPAVGTQRRIRALQALGYGLPFLAAELGIATGNLSYKMQQPYMARRTHEAVTALFERLAMLPPPKDWVAQRTRNIAAKRGWPPPLAWDDPDDPNETPAACYKPARQHRGPELLAEFEHLMALGESTHQAARLLGVTVDAIEKARERRGEVA